MDCLTYVESCLMAILGDLRQCMSIDPSSLDALVELIDAHGEYGIAYESLVALLESEDLPLRSASAVKLLEVGLLFGFKTDRPDDMKFDLRSRP